VLGPDYDLHLKDLIAALQDTAGPGKLIHPYRGELQVICRSYEASEKKGEGGYATISMEFSETEIDPPAPLAVISLGDLLGGLLGAIALVIVGIAALALVAAVAFLAVRALVRSIERFIDNIAALADLLSGGDKAIFAREVERMRAKADTYARDPEALLKDLDAALDGLGAADPEAAAEGLLSAYATDEGPEPSKNADYFVAVVGAIRQLLLLKAIGFASQATYPSHSRATAMRDRLSDLLDDQAATASEEVYQAFAEVRAQIAQTIPPRGAALPEVVSHTPTVTVPSLVLAYRLYGSTALADDIVARNGLEHPGFVPADEPLEVLSSG
jgi:prophage DNA circulation protein